MLKFGGDDLGPRVRAATREKSEGWSRVPDAIANGWEKLTGIKEPRVAGRWLCEDPRDENIVHWINVYETGRIDVAVDGLTVPASVIAEVLAVSLAQRAAAGQKGG